MTTAADLPEQKTADPAAGADYVEKAVANGYDISGPIGPQSADAPSDYDRKVRSTFEVDDRGQCLGGRSIGPGFWVTWKTGPADPFSAEPEDVLEAVAQRLEFFQAGPAACYENQAALMNIRVAISAMEMRTARRQRDGKEGTFAP